MRFAAFSIVGMLALGMLPTGRADDQVHASRQRVQELTAQVEALQQRLDAINQTKEGEQVKSEEPWVVKVYRVADLVARQKPKSEKGGRVASVYSMDDLIPIMRYIETRVATSTWETTLKGTATMAPYPQNASIVIFHSLDVHDQILLELNQLRDAYRVIDEFHQIQSYPSLPAH